MPPPVSPKKKKARKTLETVHNDALPPVLHLVFEGSVNQMVNEVLPLSKLYSASNKHVPPENNLITCTNIAEDVFITTNMPGDNECEDDISGEFECVEICQCDTISNTDPGALETVGGPSVVPTGTFVAPPLLEEAQLALDNIKKLLHLLLASHAEHDGFKDPGLDSYL